MIQLTNEMILETINKNMVLNQLEVKLFLIGIVVLIIFFIRSSRRSGEKSFINTSTILASIVLIIFFLDGFMFERLFTYDAIKYSLKNNCIEVVKDTIIRTKITDYDNCYIYLKNNGRVSITENEYDNIFRNGQTVYVVLARNVFGKKYKTGQIYLTSKYEYKGK